MKLFSFMRRNYCQSRSKKKKSDGVACRGPSPLQQEDGGVRRTEDGRQGAIAKSQKAEVFNVVVDSSPKCTSFPFSDVCKDRK